VEYIRLNHIKRIYIVKNISSSEIEKPL